MRRIAALAVVPLTALALAVPGAAYGVGVSTHHKSWHDKGGDDQPPSQPGEIGVPVLKVSESRVAPSTKVKLTATADAPILGGTWKVRNGAGEWRRLASWSEESSHTRTVTREVRSRSTAGVRYFKVVTRFADGSAASNRVAVRTVVEPVTDVSLPQATGGNGFKAVTWNVYYGTPVAELRPILRRLLNDGVSLFLMQEMSNPNARRMLEDHGLVVHYVGYQWVVAWNPHVWRAQDTWGKRLSPTSFTRHDGRGPIYVDSALAVLEEDAGRTLQVMSYHLPPNVQVRRPQRERLRIHRESAATWRRLVNSSTTDAILFGGDDNVDENNGYRSDTPFWDYMRRPYTGLRQVVAPTGTISRHRRIDDFRIRGLAPRRGYTGNGGGDHKFFVSRFAWR